MKKQGGANWLKARWSPGNWTRSSNFGPRISRDACVQIQWHWSELVNQASEAGRLTNSNLVNSRLEWRSGVGFSKRLFFLFNPPTSRVAKVCHHWRITSRGGIFSHCNFPRGSLTDETFKAKLQMALNKQEHHNLFNFDANFLFYSNISIELVVLQDWDP